MKKKNQVNNINNNHSFINNNIAIQLENAFWTGLAIGSVVGLFTAFGLMIDKERT